MFAAGLLGCLYFSQDNITANLKNAEQLRQQVSLNQSKEMSLIASQQQAEAEQEIANQRYLNGCLMVRGFLRQGEPVYKNGKALARGVTVCDEHGNTGKLIPADFDQDGRLNAVVGEVAFTGNPPLPSEKPNQEFNVRYVR